MDCHNTNSWITLDRVVKDCLGWSHVRVIIFGESLDHPATTYGRDTLHRIQLTLTFTCGKLPSLGITVLGISPPPVTISAASQWKDGQVS